MTAAVSPLPALQEPAHLVALDDARAPSAPRPAQAVPSQASAEDCENASTEVDKTGGEAGPDRASPAEKRPDRRPAAGEREAAPKPGAGSSAGAPDSPLHRCRPTATRAEQVDEVVRGYPHTNAQYGRILYNFIREHRLTRVLELGTNHGVSTCYAAAAVASLGGGHVVTIDRLPAAAYQPGVLQFSERLGLDNIIIPIFERDTYNWRLRAFLSQAPRPEFDLVFIDGAHTWEPDALAFLLTEMMLRPGGWFIFDDINWSIGESPTATAQAGSITLTAEQKRSRQVREIVDVLVRPHPNIASWHEDAKWGFARKKSRTEMALDVQQAALCREYSRASLSHARQNFPCPIPIAPDLDQPRWRKAIADGMRRNADRRRDATGEMELAQDDHQ